MHCSVSCLANLRRVRFQESLQWKCVQWGSNKGKGKVSPSIPVLIREG